MLDAPAGEERDQAEQVGPAGSEAQPQQNIEGAIAELDAMPPNTSGGLAGARDDILQATQPSTPSEERERRLRQVAARAGRQADILHADAEGGSDFWREQRLQNADQLHRIADKLDLPRRYVEGTLAELDGGGEEEAAEEADFGTIKRRILRAQRHAGSDDEREGMPRNARSLAEYLPDLDWRIEALTVLWGLMDRVYDIHAGGDMAEGCESLTVRITQATEIERRLVANADEELLFRGVRAAARH
ncbi:hypothetical protein GCM10023317_16090 [Actinopolymorpha pittospori]|nr:hypothetical protein [Actinopolymorpha pittospori]